MQEISIYHNTTVLVAVTLQETLFDFERTDVLRNDAAPLLFQFSVQRLHSRLDVLCCRKVVELLQL